MPSVIKNTLGSKRRIRGKKRAKGGVRKKPTNAVSSGTDKPSPSSPYLEILMHWSNCLRLEPETLLSIAAYLTRASNGAGSIKPPR